MSVTRGYLNGMTGSESNLNHYADRCALPQLPAVYTGEGEPLAGSIKATTWGCCGLCTEGYPECIEFASAAALNRLAKTVCTHRESSDPPLACGQCGMELLMLAEALRGSAWWASCEDPSYPGLVVGGLTLLAEIGLVDSIAESFASYDWEEEPDVFLMDVVEGLDLQAEHVWALIHALRAKTNLGKVKPRTSTVEPQRKSVTRGEIAVAERNGWDLPQRWDIEARVRTVATAAVNEAHFIELCGENGLLLYPRDGAPHVGVAGYSVAGESYGREQRREYAGGSLASDLTLRSLRAVWAGDESSSVDSEEANQRNALVTWLLKAARPHVPAAPPETRSDGRWRWLLPELAELEARPGPGRAELKSHRYRDVWDFLEYRQGGRCAMCQIRWYGRSSSRGDVPLQLVGLAEHMDHDHRTGLVRGLLCVRCNTVLEPGGAKTGEDVWRTYITDPPIGQERIMWPRGGHGKRWRQPYYQAVHCP